MPPRTAPEEAPDLLRALGQAALILAITFALAEAGARFVLGLHPLTLEPRVWEAHPLRGWTQRPGASERFVRLGFATDIRINARGLRERDIPYARTPGVARVLVIGDSGVASFEVSEEQTFMRVMERELRAAGYPVEVLNGGCRGYGTDQSLLFLRDEGMKYQPDLVLYRWSRTDPEDNLTVHRAFRRYGKPWFDLRSDGSLDLRGVPVAVYPNATALRVDESGEVREIDVPFSARLRMGLRDYGAGRSAAVAALLHLATTVPELGRSLGQAGVSGKELRLGRAKPESRLFRVTAAMVDEMRRRAAAGGARFALIGPQPAWSGALREHLGLPDLGDWTLFKERAPEGVPLTARFDAHMNATAHQLYGTVLAEVVARGELLPP